MKLRNRILLSILGLIGVAVIAGAVALSFEAPCGEGAAARAGADAMQAIVHRCYGSPATVRLEQIEKPRPADDQVLVRVYAAAINPFDWHVTTGRPYIMRMSSGIGAPDQARLGVDFAGVIVEVGGQVTSFKVGDEVFGAADGAFAEYVVVHERGAIARKPAALSFAEAASLPIAGVTALQGVRTLGQVQPGQKVLVNGASGGVGTFGVQIAKAFGAQVTGVCSTRNVELVKSIGADEVIDYKQASFVERVGEYDLIVDTVGNHSLRQTLRPLKDNGTLVIVSGPKNNRWIGPVMRWVHAGILANFVDQKLVTYITHVSREDLALLGDLAAAGKLKPVIDRRYTLAEVPDALQYIESRRARGKVIVDVYAEEETDASAS